MRLISSSICAHGAYLTFILALIQFVVSDDPSTPSPGEQIVDRLAVNLAGAFVKSMFPEMDRSKNPTTTEAPQQQVPQQMMVPQNIRRAPINQLSNSMDGYSPTYVASEYNSIPQLSQSIDNPRDPFSYQKQQPSTYSVMPETTHQQLSQSRSAGLDSLGALALGGVSGPDVSGLLGSGGGTPEAINAARNQAYLAELAKHQQELNAYSAKQLEYLDQQRRYQQAMIDHQAGAALLMQKQQQEIIQEQIKKMKDGYEAGDNPAAPKGFSENDNTVGGRVLTARARGAKTLKVPTNKKFSDDDVIANDEYLKEYFKEKYNIDIPEDVSQLSAEDRATLRALKKELMRQNEKSSDKGVFQTMDKLKEKVTSEDERSAPQMPMGSEACDQCIPLSMKMIRGAWTQIYGNPKVVNKVFGTIMSLENMRTPDDGVKMTRKKTSCVGMEIGGSAHRKSSKMNLFFRDSDEGNELHELRGTVAVRDNILNIDTNLYRTKYCLVKSGPADSERYEYMVLTETTGNNSCRSYHVFARNTDEFNRRHFDDVSEFMKSQSDVLPVGALPKAPLCELDSP